MPRCAKLGLLCPALSGILLPAENCKCLEDNAAGVAQLAERQLPKLNVAGSIPVSRSPAIRF